MIANYRLALGLGLFSTTMIAGAAHAQTPDASESSDIVVTATKRGETTVQDTALSITAFDQRALERLGTTELDQVLAQVPGVNFIDNGGPGRGTEVASIRGLSPVADNTLPIVAQYLDGAPRFIQTYRMFDIARCRCCADRRAHSGAHNRSAGLSRSDRRAPTSARSRAMCRPEPMPPKIRGGSRAD